MTPPPFQHIACFTHLSILDFEALTADNFSMEQQPPLSQPLPPSPNPPPPIMPKSSSWARMMGLSLLVLSAGLAIAFGGYYYLQKTPQPTPIPRPTIVPTSPPASPSAIPVAVSTYTNTVYKYSLQYRSDLQILGEGMQTTSSTAADVLFAPDIKAASPDPARVFHISVQDRNTTSYQNKPLSEYPLLTVATIDLALNANNKNIYVATLMPLTKIRPLQQNLIEGYTFTLNSKGYETVTGGVLWNLGQYVITELDSNKYHYVLVYSNTDEMKQMAQTLQVTQ